MFDPLTPVIRGMNETLLRGVVALEEVPRYALIIHRDLERIHDDLRAISTRDLGTDRALRTLKS